MLTGDFLAVGALSIVQLVATLIFALGGGAVADAVDRRRLLLLTQLGLAGCSLAFLAHRAHAAPSLLAIYVVMFVVGRHSGRSTVRPGPSAIPRLVPVERLQAAIGLNQLIFNAAWVIGPAIGGIVLAAFGVAAAYADRRRDVRVGDRGAAADRRPSRRRPAPSARASRPSSRASASPAGAVRCWRRSSSTSTRWSSARRGSLFPALALDVFMVGPAGVGLMWSAIGFGAMLGALFSGWTTTVRRPGRAVLIAVAVWGLGIIGFGLATFSFPLALAVPRAVGRRGRHQRGAAQLDRADPDPRLAARARVVDPHPRRHRRAGDRRTPRRASSRR